MEHLKFVFKEQKKWKQKSYITSLGSAGKCPVLRHQNTSKRRITSRSGKGHKPLNIKIAVELGLPNLRISCSKTGQHFIVLGSFIAM